MEKSVTLEMIRDAKRAYYWNDVRNADLDTTDREGPLWIWLSSFPLETVYELGERLLMPKKTQRIIEGLSQLRSDFPQISRGAHSQITFFLEKLPQESLYCYSLFCTESEKALIKKYMLKWRHVHPSFTGEDLIEMGVEPGPQMRTLLTGLRAACLDLDLGPEEEAEWLERSIEKGF